MFLIRNVINEYADPKKVSLVKEVFEKLNNKGFFSVWDFVSSKTPLAKIQDNLQTLSEAADLSAKNGRLLDAGEYLTKNTNLY